MVSGRLVWIGSLLPLVALSPGCNAIINGWLDPTVVGNFYETRTTEIRTSLTLEDTPPGIPGAVYPSPEDRKIIVLEYPITAGDTLAVEINELRERGIPFQAQAQVSGTGYVNLPIVGRVMAIQKTVPEFEDTLRLTLRERGILKEPEVMVNPLFLQEATYSIFGIGVSAANDAPLRAGTFPIRRPDLKLLEAINQVGGLNEFVTDIYVFRYDESREAGVPPAAPAVLPEPTPEDRADEPPDVGPGEADEPAGSEKADLLEAVEAEQEEPPAEPPPSEIPEELEPDRAAPYIFMNGEFVPNPEYVDSQPDTSTAPPQPPTFDTATPAVSWARIAGDIAYRVIRIPADQLRTGDPEVNICIRAGDVIRVVSGEIGVYYVMGQVNRVGPFAFNAEPITLKAAIAAAGGLSDLAWPDRCTIYRRLGQREQMIQVDLDRVFASKDPDFYIRRGDIINVGTHPFAPFLRRIRAMSLPNPSSTVGYSFTYARNFADIDSFSVRSNPHNEPDRFPGLFP
jgi:protein involved in polysaccharide export with SLBB domain